jgi:hypothetical protein
MAQGLELDKTLSTPSLAREKQYMRKFRMNEPRKWCKHFNKVIKKKDRIVGTLKIPY